MIDIKIYGSTSCHKCLYYKNYLSDREIPFTFFDVIGNKHHAQELKNLYETGKLNFPTLVINGKKLRNPSDKLLDKYLLKNNLIKVPKMAESKISELVHHEDKRQFHLDFEGATGVVRYERRDDTLFLIHAEIPFELRGKGFGKILVEKTFEYIKVHGWQAEAVCPYIKVVARRNPQWDWVKH